MRQAGLSWPPGQLNLCRFKRGPSEPRTVPLSVGPASPESEKVRTVFDRRKSTEPFELVPLHQEVVETTTFLDIGAATTVLDKVENGRPSYLVRFELTSFGPSREYTEGRNLTGTNMVIPVEERELAHLLRLTGRRMLLTQPSLKRDVETTRLEAEVTRLQEELSRATERLNLLQTNYLTLVEESRRLT